MNLRELLLGRAVRLHTTLPMDEVVSRINATTVSVLWPFNFDKIVGGSRLGFVRLGYQSSPIDYNAKPTFFGRIANRMGSTEISGHFGAPIAFKIFMAIWYFILISLLLSMLLHPEGIEPGAGPIMWIIFPAFLAAPVAMHRVCTRNSESELIRIIEYLEETVGAKPVA